MRIFIELPTWLGDAVMVTPAIENLLSNLNVSEMKLNIPIKIYNYVEY